MAGVSHGDCDGCFDRKRITQRSWEKSDSPNRMVGHFENKAIVFIRETPFLNVP